MENDKRVKTWRKIFSDPELSERHDRKRMQELSVLLSELDSVKKGSKTYQGCDSRSSVVFLTDSLRTKSELKKELAMLRKKTQQLESGSLAF